MHLYNAVRVRWATVDDRPLVVATYWDVQVTLHRKCLHGYTNGQGRIKMASTVCCAE